MDFELDPLADDGREAFRQLWQLYRHDLSGFTGTVPDGRGRFPDGRLPRYLGGSAPAWLLRTVAGPIGFCSVLPHDGFRSMGDFFVVRAVRRSGVGRAAAVRLVRSLPGAWGIAFQDDNPGAETFWKRVATDLVGADWTEQHVPVPGRPEVPPDHWLRFVQP